LCGALLSERFRRADSRGFGVLSPVYHTVAFVRFLLSG
jgi:hypothetical protein